MMNRYFFIVLCMGVSAGIVAQSAIPYQDITQRSSRRTPDRSSRSTNQPKTTGANQPQQTQGAANANAANANNNDKNANAPQQLGAQQTKNSRTVTKAMTTAGNKGSSETKTVAKPDAKKSAKAAGSKNSGTIGQVVEVNEGMLQALRTQTVEFNPEVMADTEGIIMLNPRKYEVERTRSYKSDLAQPL